MGFKKIRSLPIPEEEQGLIRYTCLTWRKQPKRVQEKIRRLCQEAGAEYADALWRVMTTRESITKISLEHSVSETTLYTIRRAFYLRW